MLFISTFYTTFLAGLSYSFSYYQIQPLENTGLWKAAQQHPKVIPSALLFSLFLMFILLTHEAGHFIAAKKWGIAATLPFIMPAPPQFLFGTFGAVIIIHSPFPDRRSLFDVGATGPIAGFLVSIPVMILGISHSAIVPHVNSGAVLTFGEPLIFKGLSALILGSIPPGADIHAHPLVFAGWFGLIVTAMNLLPVGQLDGGHIVYSLFGDKAHHVSLATIVLLMIAGIYFWPGWLIWALLLTLIGYRHPPVPPENRPGKGRIAFAVFTLLILILSFIPVPIEIRF